MYFTNIQWPRIKIATYFRWTSSMIREMSYSACRMGAYEPIKYQLGATQAQVRGHTTSHSNTFQAFAIVYRAGGVR